jgi:4,5-DOPA dioxygenase extradiol
MTTMPVLFISHGATVFTTSPQDPTQAWLSSLATPLAALRPRAIVVVSAHHLTAGDVAVTSSGRPPLLHDHPVTSLHHEHYAPAGDPVLAVEIVDALAAAGLRARADPQRGLDHGAWLPLRAMVPAADVPVVMVSLDERASALHHVAAGSALARFRDHGVVVVASGGMTHNQDEFRRGYFSGGDPATNPPAFSVTFDAWAAETLAMADADARIAALVSFRAHTDAARAHPTPEHFWPLLVAVGAARDDVGVRLHAGFQHGLSMSAFCFGTLG